jgi:hypothetical protein
MKDIIVIDDFFDDPIAVREDALSKRFDFLGNYPGMRTAGVDDEQLDFLKQKFENILNCKINQWSSFQTGKDIMNTCFQLCLEYDASWVHHDGTHWAGIAYLTPDADPDSGTGFFRHIPTNIFRWDRTDQQTDINFNAELRNPEDWQCHAEVKNIFNRLVLYRGELYHRSMKSGFGRNYIQGRLTQVFFFD